jgi:hypothetical protein
MTKEEALKLALGALRSAAAELYRASSYCNTYKVLGNTNDAITAIQQALAAQPAPVQSAERGEPVDSMGMPLSCGKPLCAPRDHHPLCKLATPPAAQRQWVGLTDEEIEKACVPLGAAMLSFTEVARAIEAKLKEKNT